MYCPSCKDSWPGHTRCPNCDARLVDMKTMLANARIERLPQFEDLARQYDLGRQERAEPDHDDDTDHDDRDPHEPRG